jgi:hypothetical protein
MCDKIGHVAIECPTYIVKIDKDKIKASWLRSRKGEVSKTVNIHEPPNSKQLRRRARLDVRSNLTKRFQKNDSLKSFVKTYIPPDSKIDISTHQVVEKTFLPKYTCIYEEEMSDREEDDEPRNAPVFNQKAFRKLIKVRTKDLVKMMVA